MTQRRARRTAIWPLAAALVCALAPLRAQDPLSGNPASIYSCTDPSGRRITSDRPIVECMGVGQRELGPGGNLRRTVPPVLTADERERETQRLQAEQDRQARLDEERRRSRALLARYPDQASHERARAEALAQIDDLLVAVRTRSAELERQRNEIEAELEFYRRDPSRAPKWLQQLQQENRRQRASQTGYLAGQQLERERVERRFDDELQRLRELWKLEGR